MDSVPQVTLSDLFFLSLSLSARFRFVNLTVARVQQIFALASVSAEKPFSEQAIYDLKNSMRKANELMDFSDQDEYDDDEEEMDDDSTSSTLLVNSTEPQPRSSPASLRPSISMCSFLGLSLLVLIETKKCAI